VMGWTLDMYGYGSAWLVNGEFVRQVCDWSPTTNRDDLADVLAKLTPEQQWKLDEMLEDQWCDVESKDKPPASIWFLTCDPAIIARAVAEVVRGDAPTEGEQKA